MLIGAGSSICGAAAVMATEPVLNAESSRQGDGRRRTVWSFSALLAIFALSVAVAAERALSSG
jgi:hypothetical protein